MVSSSQAGEPPFAFIGCTIDRAAARRTDAAWLQQVRRAESSRCLVVKSAAQLLLSEDASLGHLPAATLPPDTDLTFLGVTHDGCALFAFDAGEEEALAHEELAGRTFAELRAIGADLAANEAGLAAHAVAMVGWHRRHRYCGLCGSPTVVEEAGHSRRCSSCGAQHFPRTDPAVIMLVSAGDRCVLGKRPGLGRWTVLSGFVEPGETLEAAVAREVFEEVGVRVIEARYAASQPWPFPANLMLGFEAEAEYGALTVDDELDDARWFTRQELHESIASGVIPTPASISIASYLIRGWLERD
ncbi:MAG TPA: NAD(+) diphosphatase [Chloroflexota bacterium]|nr:NAD(+) diphosphatase [Chloroflexota bacterium]